MASNNATRNINDGHLSITKRVAECLCMRLQDAMQNKSKLKSYINALGRATTAMFDINKDISMHEFGIVLEVAPDEDEKTQLESNLQVSLAQKEIRLEDVITVRRIKNVKLANQVLMFRRKKYQEEEERKAKEAQKMNAQIQAQAAQQQSQLKQQETQLMAKVEIQNTKAKSQSRIQELQAEYQLKEQFEAQNHKRRMAEIQLNNTGKVQVATKSGDVKLKSQDKQAYNQSRMIEQKRDRALPLSQLEQKESNPLEDIGTPENPLPENLK
jgi:hypothetical protein